MNGEGLSQKSFKKFLRHLALANERKQSKDVQVKLIESQVGKLKKLTASKKSSKKKVHEEIDKFHNQILDIIHKEDALLAQQKREAELLAELKTKIESMEKQMLTSDYKHSAETSLSIKEITKINEKLDRVSRDLKQKMQRIEELEVQEEKEVKEVSAAEKRQTAKLIELEKQLKLVEQRYRALSKKKGTNKTQLKKLKTIIDSHKKQLKVIKV